ncbi:MAG TPA: hypothetical protein VLL49_05770 [Anaerolineales bacterium]|nr:hypothetical protein [Anaerolineales bacterium]
MRQPQDVCGMRDLGRVVPTDVRLAEKFPLGIILPLGWMVRAGAGRVPTGTDPGSSHA